MKVTITTTAGAPVVLANASSDRVAGIVTALSDTGLTVLEITNDDSSTSYVVKANVSRVDVA